MKKQVLFIIMLLMSLMVSAEPVEIDGICYNVVKKAKIAEVTYGLNGGLGDYYRGDVVIPDSIIYDGVICYVTSIGQNTFYKSPDLTSVTIGNRVTSIGDYAFYRCPDLTSVTIGNRVTSIGDYVFNGCELLDSITIPNSVTTIGNYTFSDCNSLKSITVGNNVTFIGKETFGGCNDLTTVHIQDLNSWCNIEFFDVTSNPLTFAHNIYLNGKELHDLTIPNTVTSIGDYAFCSCYNLTSIGKQTFSGCSGLTSIIIPNSVISIGDFAFSYCQELTSITIPKSVRLIEAHAFYNCPIASVKVESGNAVYDSRNNCNAIIITSTNELILGCKATTIPNTVTSIRDNAFMGCKELKSINIPYGVTSIGNYAFSSCVDLISVDIPNSVKSIGRSAFHYCKNLTSVTISDSMTSIESSTFRECSKLTSITIPHSVTYIGDDAFYGCSELTTVTIGNGMNNIGEYAFSGCNNLTDVYIYAESVPSLSTGVFYNSYIEYATLHVAGSINDYLNTKPWSDFGNIVSFTPVYKLTYLVDGEEYKTYEYEEGECVSAEPNPTKEGYVFSGWSEIPETMPANDVTVTGRFLLKPICATPTVTILPNGKIRVESATEGATCVTNITASNAEPLTDGEISLNTPLTVYTVTSYATKDG